jgi:hypothetical protein
MNKAHPKTIGRKNHQPIDKLGAIALSARRTPLGHPAHRSSATDAFSGFVALAVCQGPMPSDSRSHSVLPSRRVTAPWLNAASRRGCRSFR